MQGPNRLSRHQERWSRIQRPREHPQIGDPAGKFRSADSCREGPIIEVIGPPSRPRFRAAERSGSQPGVAQETIDHRMPQVIPTRCQRAFCDLVTKLLW